MNDIISEKVYYDGYIEYLTRLGWNRKTIELEKFSGTHTSKLENKKYGKFLDIECSKFQKLIFVGLSNININKEHFSKYPNLYKYPYIFGINCEDNDGNELSDDKKIRIVKITESEDIVDISYEIYEDLKVKNKKLNERYYFKDSLELNSGDHLIFETLSNINITKIEVFGKVDLFTIYK